jgi:TATA-binding protein-associated factor Taf7
MEQKITVNNKEYTMPKMDLDTYMEYLELEEQMDAKSRYTKTDIQAMLLFVTKAYGNQFTVDELKDPETGVDAAGLILAFQFIDAGVGNEIEKRMKKIEKNF